MDGPERAADRNMATERSLYSTTSAIYGGIIQKQITRKNEAA
jgi:hypothetical protein